MLILHMEVTLHLLSSFSLPCLPPSLLPCFSLPLPLLPPLVMSLQPYCDQIDQAEASVSALEQMAYRLGAYCKRLEAKFREMERK